MSQLVNLSFPQVLRRDLEFKEWCFGVETSHTVVIDNEAVAVVVVKDIGVGVRREASNFSVFIQVVRNDLLGVLACHDFHHDDGVFDCVAVFVVEDEHRVVAVNLFQIVLQLSLTSLSRADHGFIRVDDFKQGLRELNLGEVLPLTGFNVGVEDLELVVNHNLAFR